jgi:CRP-like cAMP-binding protein
MITGELGRNYKDGEVIFREGDKGNRMYAIQFGKVTIKKKTSSGEIDMATLEAGDIFGEMSLFDKQPRSATAVACGNARILSIDKGKFFATASRDPTLAFKILQSLSQRIRRLDEEVSNLKANRY